MTEPAKGGYPPEALPGRDVSPSLPIVCSKLPRNFFHATRDHSGGADDPDCARLGSYGRDGPVLPDIQEIVGDPSVASPWRL